MANILVELRSELEEKNIRGYLQHDIRWRQIAEQMKRCRDSSHREVAPDAGRANEYLLFFRKERE